MDKTRPLHCQICDEIIGFINPDADIFDERYWDSYNSHACKEWHQIEENK